jgi:hypothetical protein
LLGNFRLRRSIKAWPHSLPCISIKRELGNYQQRSADITHASVHLACIVVEDAHTRDFTDKIVSVFFAIIVFDAEKDQQPCFNLACHLSTY